MKFCASIPVKITLLGEHAVVYGEPAIASTIPRTIEMCIDVLEDKRIEVVSKGVYVELNRASFDRTSSRVSYSLNTDMLRKIFSYIVSGIELCEEFLSISKRGYSITIDSDLPVGVGLGTSAAISVGIVALCLTVNGYSPDEQGFLENVARLAWSTEKKVQGAASPMDTFTITFGGLRYIEPRAPLAHEIVSPTELPVLIGYTPKRMTTAELVARVRELISRYSDVGEFVIKGIGQLVQIARRCIEKGDLECLGVCMNANHSLLSLLNIVAPETDIIISTLRHAGALGAKMSGAGGGGAFIALARSFDELQNLARLVKNLGGEVVATRLGSEGIRIFRIA